MHSCAFLTAVYYRRRFCLLTLAEFARILLDVAERVRGKLREKLRRIHRLSKTTDARAGYPRTRNPAEYEAIQASPSV